MKFATRLFLLPGNLVCDAAGVTDGDDRSMIRTLVDMLFWNAVIIVGTVAIYV